MENRSLNGLPEPRSLYVHFPFCAHRCHYCDFSVSRVSDPPVAEWLAAVEADLRQWFKAARWRPRVGLETVFVGGGTPSLMGGRGMEGLAALLARWFEWEVPGVEWTAESNPNSLTREVCERWLASGVNRLSVGVQSFDDGALSWLGRLHNAEQAREALGQARAAGFENLNLDLIFGLPREVERNWRADLRSAIRLGTEHISAYGLTAEGGTALGRRVELGRVRMTDDDSYAEEYLSAVDLLAEAGYSHYEVSNFARPGRESRHNWHYWDGSPYLGVGPSAHSLLGGWRFWNVSRWDAYRRAASGGDPLRQGRERLEAGQERLERLWLALRTRQGLALDDRAWAERAASGDWIPREWLESGWLVQTGHRVTMTANGWLRLEGLVTTLAARLEEDCLRPDTVGGRASR
jgi:oxygen-independent coproporphyrinogen-3 oxidase